MKQKYDKWLDWLCGALVGLPAGVFIAYAKKKPDRRKELPRIVKEVFT